LIGGLSFGM